MLAKKIQNVFAISFGSVSVQDPVLNDDGSELYINIRKQLIRSCMLM